LFVVIVVMVVVVLFAVDRLDYRGSLNLPIDSCVVFGGCVVV